jgi:4-hydroxy-4-methyl-2-oxoglutarate aldolase
VNHARRLADLGTATIFEAAAAARLIDLPLRPIAPSMRLAGPARTVRCKPGDNLALHRAIAEAQPGDVIVADYGGSIVSGPFGEIMAVACQIRGVAGLIIDGAVRDSAEITKLGFPVFARGVNIRGTIKADPGELDVPLRLGGAEVGPGDYVIADADAVIVVPSGSVDEAAKAAEARAADEARMMERLRAGESTLQILGLEREKSS